MNDDLWLIVGLGNPGQKYERTWHNAGFMCIEYLSQKFKISVTKIKFKGIYGIGQIGENRVILLKPATYMNLSGESVAEAMAFFKIPVERLIVIYDDVDIEAGRIRVRENGSAGSHNGMKSIIYLLKDDRFPRIRIGAGPVPEKWDIADFVLSEIPDIIKQAVFDSISAGAKAAEDIVVFGIKKSMNLNNIPVAKKVKNNDPQ